MEEWESTRQGLGEEREEASKTNTSPDSMATTQSGIAGVTSPHGVWDEGSEPGAGGIKTAPPPSVEDMG